MNINEQERSAAILRVQPITRDEALAFITRHHRTHGRPPGYRFAIAVNDGAEVIRCCTDGTKNACSMLYGAAWRAARAMGYRRIITYTLPEGGGSSLRGAGWRVTHQTKAESWHRRARPRVDKHPTQAKLRWVRGA